MRRLYAFKRQMWAACFLAAGLAKGERGSDLFQGFRVGTLQAAQTPNNVFCISSRAIAVNDYFPLR